MLTTDGSLPPQLGGVWSRLLEADSEGPSFIFHAACARSVSSSRTFLSCACGAPSISPARRAYYVQRGRETKAGPKVAIPDYETLMLPVLKAAAGGEVAIRECVSRIGNEIGLSEAERNQLLPSSLSDSGLRPSAASDHAGQP